MAAGDYTGGAMKNWRNCAPMKLMLNSTAATVGGLPQLLNTTTYPALATIARGTAPQLLGDGIWVYRPPQEVKVLGLSFLSDTASDGDTVTYDIGLYPMLQMVSAASYNLYQFGKRHRAVLTNGTLTNASVRYEPFTGYDLGSAKTIRHFDTASWTYRDTGDLQVYDKGFDAANGTGTIYVDMTGFDLIAMVLQAKSGSSARELVGIVEECS